MSQMKSCLPNLQINFSANCNSSTQKCKEKYLIYEVENLSLREMDIKIEIHLKPRKAIHPKIFRELEMVHD